MLHFSDLAAAGNVLDVVQKDFLNGFEVGFIVLVDHFACWCIEGVLRGVGRPVFVIWNGGVEADFVE